MARPARRKARQHPYDGWRQFTILFLLPYLAVLLPFGGLAYLAASSLSGEIRANTLNAARESLLERKRVFFESVQAAKRASYEIAHNPDAIKLVGLSTAAVTPGIAARQLELLQSVENYSRRLTREIDFYESVFYLNAKGDPVYSRQSSELFAVVDPRSSAFFSSSVQGNVALDGPFVIGVDKRSVVVVSSPAYDESNRYAGAAGIVIEVSRFFEPVLAPRYASRTDFGIIDENGFVLGAGGSRISAQSLFPDLGPAAASLHGQMDQTASGSGFMALSPSEDALVVWEALSIKPWTIVAIMDAGQVRRPELLANAMAGAAMLAAGLGLAIGMFRSRQLRLKNRQLEATIGELGEAQGLLIRSERSAVLGSAIAGLAHELNTPIGVALTSATFVRDLAGLAREPGSAEAALEEIRKAAAVLSSSLKRAGSIIDSFKRVSEEGGDETTVVLELGQAVEDAVSVLTKPLQESNAHAVFTRDVPVFVKASTASLNRVVASIVAGVAAWPSHSTPKLFQVLVSGLDDKALAEFSLHPLPVLQSAAPGAEADGHASSQRFGARTIEAGIVKTLVEKDLGGTAVVKASQDGGFTVIILLNKAETVA